MEPENALTTETTESDVSVEPIEQSSEYDEAWDKLDVNDSEAVNNLFAEPEESTTTPDEQVQTTDEAIQEEASNAFMQSNPTLKFKGKEIPIDNPQELIDLAQKGFKLETEMSNIKPQKKVLQTVGDVPLDVLQAVADLHGGKEEALDFLRQHYGIEQTNQDDYFSQTSDEEKPSKYKPETVSTMDNPIDDFWTDYAENNVASAGQVTEIYNGLESSFQSEIYKPDVFQAFVKSVESGEFDTVYPIAIKEKSLNPALSWVQAYGAAASKAPQPVTETNEPPISAQPATTAQQDRNVSASDAAARVWDDPAYFNEVGDKYFN